MWAPSQKSRWLWPIIGLVTVAVLGVFWLGASRENRMVRELALARSSAAERVFKQQRHMEAWVSAQPEERALWQSIAAEYAAQATGEKVRLTVPYALAALADECGIQGICLAELDEGALKATVLDDLGSIGVAWRPLAAPSPEEDPFPAEQVEDAIAEFGYRMRFHSSYPALDRFLTGLERMAGMISVHSVVINRSTPRAEVDLVLVAHGRRT